ncbi:MAG: amino acid permease [Lapillicoccus sp.]
MAPTSRSGLTVAQGAALTIGAVLGTGVISLPAMAAGIAGPASVVAWAALVVLSAPLAMTFAALGARFPDAGGISTYARRAFGDRAATAVGWLFYAVIPVGAPPAAAFAGGYVADLVGGSRSTTMWAAAGIVLVVTVLNAFGVRVSGRVQLAMASVLAVLLTVATLAALPHADLAHLTPFAPNGWAAVGPAAAVVVWGFAGWEAVTSLTADYRDPARDVPRAAVVAVVVVGVLYLGIVAASILVLGPRAGASQAPLAELLGISFGAPGRIVTTVVAVLLTVGAMNAYFAGGAKLGAALGRDGSLPAWFARGGRAGEVPRRALLVTAALSMASVALTAALQLDLSSSVLIATGAFTVIYVVGTAAAIRLLPRGTWAWRGAVVSFVSVVILLLLNGTHALWTIVVALLAAAYEALASRRRTATSRRNPSSTRPDPTAPYPTTSPSIAETCADGSR